MSFGNAAFLSSVATMQEVWDYCGIDVVHQKGQQNVGEGAVWDGVTV